jgi:hypothetical protein
MYRNLLFIAVTFLCQTGLSGQTGQLVRKPVTPVRIVWMSDTAGIGIKNPGRLLKPGNGQADLSGQDLCYLINESGKKASLILDFGTELQGAVQIVTGITGGKKPVVLRVRLGESVSETLSETDSTSTATNDHAMRDFQITLPWLGRIETGSSGFRFARIDLLGEEASACIKEINAISEYRDIARPGSFRCNDELLNTIWETSVRTVHLNMQEFLWDGIKRDRLVWIGDMHPEVSTILSVFGDNEVIRKSLDLIRDITPVSEWMNGISSYSMWWVLIQSDLYAYTGDRTWLLGQKAYLSDLLKKFCSMVDQKGVEQLDGHRFLDWPSSPDKRAVDAGYQGLLLMTLRAGAGLCEAMGDTVLAAHCSRTADIMATVRFSDVTSKQAAALLGLSGLMPDREADQIIAAGGAAGFSTFYGYYMLRALARAGNYDAALKIIRDYWGGMIDLGATTFWEDFDIAWLKGASRIDELPVEGLVDVHKTYGGYCYKGYRHSFCHGWASGPAAWMTENVLGVTILEAGCRKIRVVPHLGDLEWAEGTVPTPLGPVKVRHDRRKDGSVTSSVNAPEGIEVVRK